MRIVCQHLQQRQRIRDAIPPVAEDTRRGGARPGIARLQHPRQQLLVDDVVPLVHPQGFHHLVLVLRVLRIEAANPRLDRGDDFLRIAAAQFDLRAIPDAILGLLQQVEQPRNRRARNHCRLEERTARVRHPVDATVVVVAGRVPEVVLHVADDGVVPVREVQRAIGSDLRVNRPEVLVGGREDRLDFR